MKNTATLTLGPTAMSYGWPTEASYPYDPSSSYGTPSGSTSTTPKRAFHEISGYEQQQQQQAGTFQELLQPTPQHPHGAYHHLPPVVHAKRNSEDAEFEGEVDDDDGAGQVEKPRHPRRGGPRIPKGIEMFPNFHSAMEALQVTMVPTAMHVDFSANFLVENDPPLSDKERVKALAREIWKATGYRFTIKDHPQLKEGHKTRFWCSQDVLGRSKSKGPASVDSKIRYQCKSSLLVSCKCDDPDFPDIRLCTIRLHHRMCHPIPLAKEEPPDLKEPEVNWDSPPVRQISFQAVINGGEIASRRERPRKRAKPATAPAAPSEGGLGYPAVTVPPPPPPAEGYLSIAETDGLLSRVRPPPPFLATSATAAPSSTHASTSTAPTAPTGPQETSAASTSMFADFDHSDQSYPSPSIGYPSPIPQHQHQPQPHHPTSSSSSHHPSHGHSHQMEDPTVYRGKMELHIRQIRDFCDGLEYNLQFGDQRMLSELERRGSGFLELVRECLAREGRLVS